MTVSQTTDPQSEPAVTATQEGIVGFYAEHTSSKDYQAAKVGIHYSFGMPVPYVDAVARFGEVQQQAEEQAEAKLADTLNRRAAQAQAVQPAAPAPAPAPVPAQVPAPQPQAAPPAVPHPAQQAAEALGGQQVDGPPVVATGTTPKGSQLRYVPSTSLSSKALEDAVRAQIGQHGFNPDDFAVFDNRVTREGSQYAGLEDGGQAYSAVTIRARNDTPWQAAIGEKTTAFYADFDDTGKLHVKPSKQLEQARSAAQAFAGQQ